MGTRGLCLGRWLFRLLLTEHYGTRGSGLRTAVPGMDRPYCLCPPPLRDPARLLRQRQDTAPKYGHPDQQFLPARPPLSGLPWPPCPQGCLLASSGRKAGSPVEGAGEMCAGQGSYISGDQPHGETGPAGPPRLPHATFLPPHPEASFFCARCLPKRVGSRSPRGECWGLAMPWGSRWGHPW